MFNAHSVHNKAGIIHQFIIDSKSSMVTIIEIWLTNNNSSIPSQFTPTNFDIINKLLLFNGGGLAILYSFEFKLLLLSIPSTISCEILNYRFCYPIQLLFNIFLFIVHDHHYLTTFYLT